MFSLGEILRGLMLNQVVYMITVSLNTSKTQSNPYTSLDRPRGLQEIETLRISRQSAREGGKVVSTKQRPSLPRMRYPWY